MSTKASASRRGSENDSLTAIIDTSSNAPRLIEALLELASTYEDSNPDSALSVMRKAATVANSLKDTNYMALVNLRMANVHAVMGQPDSSSVLIFKAIYWSQESNNLRRLGQCYQTLGMNAGMMGNIEEAISYTVQAVKTYNRGNLTSPLFPCYHNLVYAYGYTHELDSAKKYYQIANEFLDTVEVFNARSGINAALGSVYQKAGDFHRAKQLFKQALELNLDSNESYIMGEYNRLIGRNYRLSGQVDSALPYAQKAVAIQTALGSLPGMSESLWELSLVYEGMGELALALKTVREHDILRDSLFSETKLSVVKDLELQYEAEKRQQQNEVLAKALEIQELNVSSRNSFIAILLLSVLLLISIGLLVIKRMKFTADGKELKLEQKVIRSQMNPHFLFNALGSIQHIVYNNDRLFAVTNLAVFARLMRRVLDHSTKELISVREEMDVLKPYVALEALRFPDSFNHRIEADPQLAIDNTYVPPMLVQPFVENAIKHGLLNKEPMGGDLLVRFTGNANLLECIIEDNGVGRKKAAEIRTQMNPAHRSFSGEAIRKRIELLNKMRDTKIEVMVEDLCDGDQPIGTRVTLKLPQKKKK